MRKVLVVEDQAEIRKLVRMTLSLKAKQYEIHEAADGCSGLKLVESVAPDVVLLDVMMPGDLDGLDVCKRIKEDPSLRDTIVMILSAKGQVADIEAGESAGADAYVVKPFSPLELADKVEAMCRGRTGKP